MPPLGPEHHPSETGGRVAPRPRAAATTCGPAAVDADKLIHHQLDYKLVLDTIRIACANAESELAVTLAPHLPRAAEAKKVLANLFAAPGQVRVAATTITITLRPAGTSRELEALSRVLNQLDVHNLALPGDLNSRLRSWISQDS